MPVRRHELLKWYGWGYLDSEVYLNGETGDMIVTSDRYPGVNNCYVPQSVREYMLNLCGVDMYKTTRETIQAIKLPDHFPEPIINEPFVKELTKLKIWHTSEGVDRHYRAHGHGIDELVTLRKRQQFARIPDVIVFPTCHDDVVKIVELANEHDVVIVPYGGGTNVSRALALNPKEKRSIASLDTSQMNRVLWVDKENLMVCCEAGIVGQDLVKELKKYGLTSGHEPDSYEFSSLGGWVATRASGMKKNLYGNIEDIVVSTKFVTPSGVLERQNQAQRVSCGPDFNQIILGSEGTLGVVTEVTLKVRPEPEVQEYGSYVLPTFELGVAFMREVALRRCQPASLRLMDNDQFKLGKLFKEREGPFGEVLDYLKDLYITKYQGINLDSMCVVIAVFEGEKADVDIQKKKISQIVHKYKGFAGGSENGKRGYLLTFTISYLRDLCLANELYTESTETSVPWDRVITLINNVKSVAHKESKRRNIEYFQCNCRLTQVYDTGACLYFYFGINSRDVPDAVHVFEHIETLMRDEILASGGSLSHHHGVGKIRQKWFSDAVSPLGVELCKAIKRQLDPNNIFAVGNLWKQD